MDSGTLLTIGIVGLWAVIHIAGWIWVFSLADLKKDFCPRIYLGYACHREASNDGCDHSNHAWATLGIDKDQLYEQPIRNQNNDPLASKK